jgi:putative spermidine/putrescine transport system permease protein
MARRAGWFAWFIYVFGAFYFILPLFGTFIFSLQKTRGAIGFSAYAAAFANPGFLQTFLFSCLIAALTILASLALIVPTAFWVNLRMPKWRGVVEFITLLPFVIPAIVLVFGIIKTFGKPVTLFGVPVLPSLLNTELSTNLVLVGRTLCSRCPTCTAPPTTGCAPWMCARWPRQRRVSAPTGSPC